MWPHSRRRAPDSAGGWQAGRVIAPFRRHRRPDTLSLMEPVPAVNRWLIASALLLACAAPGFCQNAAWQLGEDLRFLPPPPPRARATCKEVHEAGRAVPRLQALFPHLWAAVLDDVKEFELRPEGIPGEWVEPIRRWSRIAGDCAPPVAAISLEQRQAWERLSGDERALRGGGMQRRLINLAITGRVTKVEFDRLVDRLEGN
jgi:hypothetical protein